MLDAASRSGAGTVSGPCLAGSSQGFHGDQTTTRPGDGKPRRPDTRRMLRSALDCRAGADSSGFCYFRENKRRGEATYEGMIAETLSVWSFLIRSVTRGACCIRLRSRHWRSSQRHSLLMKADASDLGRLVGNRRLIAPPCQLTLWIPGQTHSAMCGNTLSVNSRNERALIGAAIR